MLKLREDAIVKMGEKYYYHEKLFTGVAFAIDDCIVVRAVEYRDGVEVCDYVSEFLSESLSGIKVLFDCLEQEVGGYEEPLIFRGERFSGVCYEFDEEICSGEFVVRNGWLESRVTYYRTGGIDSVELMNDDFAQKNYWYESGKVRRFELFERNVFDVAVEFDENDRVKVLRIEGRYFERAKNAKEVSRLNPLGDRESICQLNGAASFYVSGTAIDDDLLSCLVTNGGLEHTHDLRIHSTRLTAAGARELAAEMDVKRLVIDSDLISLEEIKDLQSEHPDWYIKFNNKELGMPL